VRQDGRREVERRADGSEGRGEGDRDRTDKRGECAAVKKEEGSERTLPFYLAVEVGDGQLRV
jgi:hypothetical protein